MKNLKTSIPVKKSLESDKKNQLWIIIFTSIITTLITTLGVILSNYFISKTNLQKENRDLIHKLTNLEGINKAQSDEINRQNNLLANKDIIIANQTSSLAFHGQKEAFFQVVLNKLNNNTLFVKDLLFTNATQSDLNQPNDVELLPLLTMPIEIANLMGKIDILYNAHDYSNAMIYVKKAIQILDPIFQPLTNQSFKIELNFASFSSQIYAMMGEYEFSRKNYEQAETYSQYAISIVGNKPNPFYIALENASQTRKYNLHEFMSSRLQNIIMLDDKQYVFDVLNMLAQMGYLRAHMVDVKNDSFLVQSYEELLQLPDKIQYRSYIKLFNSDIFSTRWEGYQNYSVFNYSETIRNAINYVKNLQTE